MGKHLESHAVSEMVQPYGRRAGDDVRMDPVIAIIIVVSIVCATIAPVILL